ncbi:hypothetical protein [Olivibacter sitiensis]|uniref:hypothetical protein n=1 Tax=Olivibacter sitiensis TaxID=376470 RepID=UPI00146FAE9A|nr:hypothetical protein [Olivibacter sitiensis]
MFTTISHLTSSPPKPVNGLLDKLLLSIEIGQKDLVKDLVYTANILSRFNSSDSELQLSVPRYIYNLAADACLTHIHSNNYSFLEGAGAYMLFLRNSRLSDELGELMEEFMRGLEIFIDEKVYKTLDSPTFELANLIDILLYLPKPDIEFYIYRRSLLEKCMEALLDYWQEVSLEDQRFTFFGPTPESSMRKILPLLHGDLLPAKALMDYATFTGKASFFRSGHAIALNTLLCPVLLENDVSNTSFYEGSLGIAYLYSEFFRMTGDCRFHSAFEDWLKITKENSFQPPLCAMPIRTNIDHLVTRTFIEKAVID